MVHGLLRFLAGCGLRIRLLLFVVFPLAGILAVVGFSVLLHLEREGEKKMQEEVELVARALRTPLAYALEKNRTGTLERSLESAFEIGRVYGAYLYDDTGNVQAKAGDVLVDGELKTSIGRAFATGERTGEYSEVAGRSVYSYFVPLEDTGGEMIGLLQVTRRERDFRDYMKQLRAGTAMYVVLGGSLMVGVVFVGYHHAVGKPLDGLRLSMVKVERGERSHRAQREGPREIASLASSLNAMLNSIAEAQEEIAERRASEAELQRQLRQSEKLAHLGQIAAGVAHELGAPLSLVDGKSQRLLRRAGSLGNGLPLVHEIREQVRRMERLIRQLLEFGRSGSLHRKLIRADRIAAMAQRALQESPGGRPARIEMEGSCPGPEISADAFRIDLALQNLMRNALQASPGQRVKLSWLQTSSHVEFRVGDDGPGIDPGLRTAIFDPFFTTKPSAQGSGLGLSIVHQVAVEHGGRVEVGRSEWNGAEFRLLLPHSGATSQST